jgi:hypothetical protein
MDQISKFIRDFRQKQVLMLPKRAFVQWFKVNWGMSEAEACCFELAPCSVVRDAHGCSRGQS